MQKLICSFIILIINKIHKSCRKTRNLINCSKKEDLIKKDNRALAVKVHKLWNCMFKLATHLCYQFFCFWRFVCFYTSSKYVRIEWVILKFNDYIYTTIYIKLVFTKSELAYWSSLSIFPSGYLTSFEILSYVFTSLLHIVRCVAV